MGRYDRESGFSLVEMLLVLVLLALATGLVMARPNPDRTAATAQVRLADYLREARALAILDGRIVALVIDSDSGQISGPPSLGEIDLRARVSLGPAQTPADGLVFQPDGSTCGAEFHIIPDTSPRSGASSRSVSVAPVTGIVTLLP